MKPITLSVFTILLAALPVSARCPISANGTVVIRTVAGNLVVDTSATDFVDIDLGNRPSQVQETCGKDRVEEILRSATQIADWKILVPRSVNLDLATSAGNVTVTSDSDGNLTIRSGGGTIVTGNIGGTAVLINQAGSVKAGNINGSAEIRSQGGFIEVGNVLHDAEFHTAHGSITAGVLGGRAVAETGGGVINIRESRGELLTATTQGGDITIGNAIQILAKTTGGNITTHIVRGPFRGNTEQGDIRIEQAGSWIEAYTGHGNIFCRLIPDTLEGDLHVTLEAGIGDITFYVPAKLKATVEATVRKPRFNAPGIHSDLPGNALSGRGITPNALLTPERTEERLNGGGVPIKLRAYSGNIYIRKQ